MLFLEIKNYEGVILYSNISDDIKSQSYIDKENIKIREWYIKVLNIIDNVNLLRIKAISLNNKDMYKSNRLFKTIINIYISIIIFLNNAYTEKISYNIEVISNIQELMSNDVNVFIRQQEFITSCYQELLDKIKEKILQSPDKASELVIKMSKHIKELYIKIDENDDYLYWKIDKTTVDITKLSKISKKSGLNYEDIIEYMYNVYLRKIDLHSHTIKTIQAKMSQEFDLFINQREISQHNNIVKDNEEKASILIAQLSNRIREISFHIDSLNLLYYNQDIEIQLSEGNLKKILLKMYSPFQNTFIKNNVNLKFNFPETYKIKMNYDILNLVMHHFFHNAEKYVKENTIISFNIIKETNSYLNIEMISLIIHDKDKIFEEWYSWKNTDNLGWRGIWMYVIKKWLQKMWMDIFVKDEHIYNENKYKKNIFSFKLI